MPLCSVGLGVLLVPGSGQGKVKSCSNVQFSFGPGAAPVTADNSTHIRETNAGSFKFIGMMQALENAEEFLGVLHVESDAIVADGNNVLLCGAGITYFHICLWSGAGVLDGIGQ